eukprot:m.1425024 g.1425024  ORF g.1425024 m.1425024 type:complete len:1498 (+) comp25063_c0_seq2:254-4747(+)
MHTNDSSTTLPSIVEQTDTLTPLLQLLVEDSEVGSVWYVLPSKWMKTVRRYLGLEPSRSGSDKKPSYPTPMDSTGLYKPNSDGYGYSVRPIELRKDLEIGNQIEVVCEEAYELMRKWYGAGYWHKDIKRNVIETVDADGKVGKELELWPVVFPLCECGSDGEPHEKRKQAIAVSRTLDCVSLVNLAIKEFDTEASDGISGNDEMESEVPKKNFRVWYSSDGDVWTVIGDCEGIVEGTPERVSDLPKLLSSPKRSLMVEVAVNGQWLRSGEDMVKVVADMTAKLHAVDKMTDEDWRKELSVGDFCDHLDPGCAATDTAEAVAKKWREAEVLAVGVDEDGAEVVTLTWRGHPNHRVTVQRSDTSLAKPYSKARDWRNQLRTNTKVEVHMDALAAAEGINPSESSPVYRMGTYFFYFYPAKAEWWIGDVVPHRHGYINAECNTLNPLDIPTTAWSYYDTDKYCRGWERAHGMTVTEKVPGPNPGDFPEAVEIQGHTGCQAEKMGVYTRTYFIMADVHRIDRKQGKLEVIVKKERGYHDTLSRDIVKGIRLYSGQVCEPGTHLTIPKRKSNWSTENIEAVDDDDGTGKRRGCVGLRNLGNTCFMNSMLQCLNAATSLQSYFVSKHYENEINTKNALGTGGVLAQSYGALVEDMWAGTFRVVAPTDFKDTLGRFAPQFAGFQQQDSMELFSYLLDNLHEDLNRIIKKPYVEDIDDDKKMSDVELAQEKWRRYKLRNDSVIVDQMMGQFRSHLTCPKDTCRHESRKFDEYSSVALPLPQKATKSVNVSVVYMDVTRPALSVTVNVSKKGKVTEIVTEVCQLLDGLSTANVMLVELVHGKTYRTFYTPAFTKKEIDTLDAVSDGDILFLYEIPPTNCDTSDACVADGESSDDEDTIEPTGYSTRYNANMTGGNARLRTTQSGVYPGPDFDGLVVQVGQSMRVPPVTQYHTDLYEHMGPPRLFVFDKDVSCKSIHDTIWNWVAQASEGVYTLDDVQSRDQVFDSHCVQQEDDDADTAAQSADSEVPSRTWSSDSLETQTTSNTLAEDGTPEENNTEENNTEENNGDNGTTDSDTTTDNKVADNKVEDNEADNAVTADSTDQLTNQLEKVSQNVESQIQSTAEASTEDTPSAEADNSATSDDTAGGTTATNNDAPNPSNTDASADQPRQSAQASASPSDENDENKRAKQAAVDDASSPAPLPPPAYSVSLADEYYLIRNYQNDAMVTLPYADVSFQSVRDVYKKPVNCCVVFDRDSPLFQKPNDKDETEKATPSNYTTTAVVTRRKLAASKSLVRQETFVDPASDSKDDNALTLPRCLEAFSVREQLGKMDTWYCPNCKDHVQAFKKMDLWSVPPILTLHLKRFQYETGYFREKLDVPVKFDEIIDMRDFVLGPQVEEDLTYELFAVSNHIGFGIGGGHYTAYAKHGQKWILFNDGTFSDAEAKDVCTEEAYVLFYRRRSLHVDAEDSADDDDGGGGGGGREGSDDATGVDGDPSIPTATTASDDE